MSTFSFAARSAVRRAHGYAISRRIKQTSSDALQIEEGSQFVYTVQVSPSRSISQVSLDGIVGQEVDFDNSRLGSGTTLNLNATFRPTDHLELALVESDRRLDVDGPGGVPQHLFTANVSRAYAFQR